MRIDNTRTIITADGVSGEISSLNAGLRILRLQVDKKTPAQLDFAGGDIFTSSNVVSKMSASSTTCLPRIVKAPKNLTVKRNIEEIAAFIVKSVKSGYSGVALERELERQMRYNQDFKWLSESVDKSLGDVVDAFQEAFCGKTYENIINNEYSYTNFNQSNPDWQPSELPVVSIDDTEYEATFDYNKRYGLGHPQVAQNSMLFSSFEPSNQNNSNDIVFASVALTGALALRDAMSKERQARSAGRFRNGARNKQDGQDRTFNSQNMSGAPLFPELESNKISALKQLGLNSSVKNQDILYESVVDEEAAQESHTRAVLDINAGPVPLDLSTYNSNKTVFSNELKYYRYCVARLFLEPLTSLESVSYSSSGETIWGSWYLNKPAIPINDVDEKNIENSEDIIQHSEKILYNASNRIKTSEPSFDFQETIDTSLPFKLLDEASDDDSCAGSENTLGSKFAPHCLGKLDNEEVEKVSFSHYSIASCSLPLTKLEHNYLYNAWYNLNTRSLIKIQQTVVLTLAFSRSARYARVVLAAAVTRISRTMLTELILGEKQLTTQNITVYLKRIDAILVALAVLAEITDISCSRHYRVKLCSFFVYIARFMAYLLEKINFDDKLEINNIKQNNDQNLTLTKTDITTSSNIEIEVSISEETSLYDIQNLLPDLEKLPEKNKINMSSKEASVIQNLIKKYKSRLISLIARRFSICDTSPADGAIIVCLILDKFSINEYRNIATLTPRIETVKPVVQQKKVKIEKDLFSDESESSEEINTSEQHQEGLHIFRTAGNSDLSLQKSSEIIYLCRNLWARSISTDAECISIHSINPQDDAPIIGWIPQKLKDVNISFGLRGLRYIPIERLRMFSNETLIELSHHMSAKNQVETALQNVTIDSIESNVDGVFVDLSNTHWVCSEP